LGAYTLAEIASRIEGTVRGDPGRTVRGIKPLDQAGPEDLSFVAHPRYRRAANDSLAAGLIVAEGGIVPGRNLILVRNPYAALASVMDLFHAPTPPSPGLSPQAVLGEGTRIGRDVSIGPFVVTGRGCVIGDRAALLPGVILGDEVHIGEETVLHPGVVVYSRSVLGARVTVHASSVIGSDGFGYAEESGARAKIPQVGNVVIEDDVEIGACTTIDRATFGSTIVKRGAKIDNLVQIGHNVTVGEDSVLVAQSGIAGSTRLGRGVILAGQSGAAGHLTLGDRAVVGAKSAVLQDVPAGSFVVGHPADDHRRWKRSQAALRRLPDLVRAVARLERAAERVVTIPRSTGTGRRAPRGSAQGAGKRRRGRS
jgi:UDP-3-O-[3-hydroxymyristoyl] glucosamine N-acyltransferase